MPIPISGPERLLLRPGVLSQAAIGDGIVLLLGVAVLHGETTLLVEMTVRTMIGRVGITIGVIAIMTVGNVPMNALIVRKIATAISRTVETAVMTNGELGTMSTRAAMMEKVGHGMSNKSFD